MPNLLDERADIEAPPPGVSTWLTTQALPARDFRFYEQVSEQWQPLTKAKTNRYRPILVPYQGKLRVLLYPVSNTDPAESHPDLNTAGMLLGNPEALAKKPMLGADALVARHNSAGTIHVSVQKTAALRTASTALEQSLLPSNLQVAAPTSYEDAVLRTATVVSRRTHTDEDAVRVGLSSAGAGPSGTSHGNVQPTLYAGGGALQPGARPEAEPGLASGSFMIPAEDPGVALEGARNARAFGCGGPSTGLGSEGDKVRFDPTGFDDPAVEFNIRRTQRLISRLGNEQTASGSGSSAVPPSSTLDSDLQSTSSRVHVPQRRPLPTYPTMRLKSKERNPWSDTEDASPDPTPPPEPEPSLLTKMQKLLKNRTTPSSQDDYILAGVGLRDLFERNATNIPVLQRAVEELEDEEKTILLPVLEYGAKTFRMLGENPSLLSALYYRADPFSVPPGAAGPFAQPPGSPTLRDEDVAEAFPVEIGPGHFDLRGVRRRNPTRRSDDFEAAERSQNMEGTYDLSGPSGSASGVQQGSLRR